MEVDELRMVCFRKGFKSRSLSLIISGKIFV